MSDIHAFDRTSVLARVPADISAKLQPKIWELNQLGVRGAGGSTGGFGDVGSVQLANASLKATLKTVFPKGGDKVTDILHSIKDDALLGGVHEKLQGRLSTLKPEDLKTLQGLLHYSDGEAQASRTSTEDRQVIRTAMLLAFAHGANLDEVARLKSYMNAAYPAHRNDVLSALNGGAANATRMLNSLERDAFQA